MNTIVWSSLGRFIVKAKADGRWTKIHDWLSGPVILKISVTDASDTVWQWARGRACGADGDETAPLDRSRCIVPSAPPGCLIGKIGGSTADDTGAFPVGSFIARRVAASEAGPLYLTINDLPSGYEDNSGQMDVEVLTAQAEPL